MGGHPLSEEFARGVADFLNHALPTPTKFSVVDVGDALRFGPWSSEPAKFATICMAGDGSGPRLRVEFSLSDDESGRFFRVQSSVFGLYVPYEKGGREAAEVPVIRVEYQRGQTPPAHVHFHMSSEPLGWIYGASGGNYRQSDALHFPVGSERFRPTIEDFLLFLDHERLFRGWRPESGWRKAATARLAKYERGQARALVKHYTDEIADELRAIGWTVLPPAS